MYDESGALQQRMLVSEDFYAPVHRIEIYPLKNDGVDESVIEEQDETGCRTMKKRPVKKTEHKKTRKTRSLPVKAGKGKPKTDVQMTACGEIPMKLRKNKDSTTGLMQ